MDKYVYITDGHTPEFVARGLNYSVTFALDPFDDPQRVQLKYHDKNITLNIEKLFELGVLTYED